MRTVELRSAAARAPAFADGRPSLSVCAASFRRIVLCLRISRHTLPCEKISSRPNQGSELAHSNKFRRSSRKCNTPLPLTLCPPPSPCVSFKIPARHHPPSPNSVRLPTAHSDSSLSRRNEHDDRSSQLDQRLTAAFRHASSAQRIRAAGRGGG